MGGMGKLLVFFGLILVLTGFAVQLVGKVPGFGRLPGDIYIKKGPVTFYFPMITSLIISLVLSLILSLFWRK
ncbi:MAG TPA: DUF2905 domain-containing protein [Candidatus Omnitrophota bacterium]|nr:DUF2905 domain-containing protein [Candidatus Omnitrophota bacterium]